MFGSYLLLLVKDLQIESDQQEQVGSSDLDHLCTVSVQSVSDMRLNLVNTFSTYMMLITFTRLLSAAMLPL